MQYTRVSCVQFCFITGLSKISTILYIIKPNIPDKFMDHRKKTLYFITAQNNEFYYVLYTYRSLYFAHSHSLSLIFCHMCLLFAWLELFHIFSII